MNARSDGGAHVDAPDDRPLDEFFSAARVESRDGAVLLGEATYREHVYDLADPAVAEWRGMDYAEFSERRVDNPFVQELLADWNALYEEPFRGVTNDGIVCDEVWHHPLDGSGRPEPVEAARRALATLSRSERAAISHEIDDPRWRAWSNPEFVIHRVGVRLEELTEAQVDALLAMIEASLSAEGYARVRDAMRLNGYLGDLVDLPLVLNERSYWMAIYGTPDVDEPWGWQLFGHHVAVHFATAGGRDVVAPVFIGAEPALSDDAGQPIFAERERRAIELASSLSDAQRDSAIVYRSVLDPTMPDGRLHPADERHVAGAFRDNRVVPYEGIRASELDSAQRDALRAIVEDFHLLLEDGQRARTMAAYDAHIDETFLSWYGATDGSEPVYFRIQSPVILAELDHHAGVWLDNRLPARFHVHSTLRLPNGNDYGFADRRRAR